MSLFPNATASRARANPPAFSWRATLLSIWESEGVLSWRLLAATAIVAFALVMRGLGTRYMSTDESIRYLTVAVELAALGTLKVVASRFAPKPTVDPTQQPSKTADA